MSAATQVALGGALAFGDWGAGWQFLKVGRRVIFGLDSLS